MHYHPSTLDVPSVKDILTKRLPLELVDNIIDLAEYWPHTTEIWSLPETRSGFSLLIPRRYGEENELVLRTYPLGYVPNENNLTDVSYSSNKYKQIAPIPGPNLKERTQTLTENVLNEWRKESHLRGEFPCRKIKFTIQSHDQGWGGDMSEGIYENSYTWFDVGKEEIYVFEDEDLSNLQSSDESSGSNPQTITEPVSAWSQGPFFVIHKSERRESENVDTKRLICASQTIVPKTISKVDDYQNTDSPSSITYTFQHELLPDSRVLQKNARAQKETREHVIVWSYNDNVDPESAAGDNLEKNGRGRATADGEFVRNLKAGEIITVWKKSRFAGWSNHVKMIRIDVSWAV